MTLLEKWKQKARALRLEVIAVYLACRHPETLWHARALALALVAMAVSPLDLIPDFIPVLGYLDDLVIIPLGIALVIRMVPPRVMVECRQKARLGSGQLPGGRAGTYAIIAFWLALAGVAAWWGYRLFFS